MSQDTERLAALPGAADISSGVEEYNEINLVELLFWLLENLKYMIIAIVLCTLIAYAYTEYGVEPVFESTAKLYVQNSNDSVVNLADLQMGTYLASDYQEVFKTWELHEQVIDNLQLPYSYTQMQSMLAVSNPNDTRILYIKIRSGDPDEAAKIANEYARVARNYIASVMIMEKPSILSEALANYNPVEPSLTKNVMIGAMLGLLLAVGALTLVFIFDDTIKSGDEITKYTGMVTLSVIPLVGTESGLADKSSSAKKKKRQQRGAE